MSVVNGWFIQGWYIYVCIYMHPFYTLTSMLKNLKSQTSYVCAYMYVYIHVRMCVHLHVCRYFVYGLPGSHSGTGFGHGTEERGEKGGSEVH